MARNKIYYLSTCDTCKKILKDIHADHYDFECQEIKTEALTAQQIDALAKRTGSYEALINKRATLYKEQRPAEKNLSEQDYRQLLLQHYTFLKRPVIDYKGQLFIGNEKKTVEAIKAVLSK